MTPTARSVPVGLLTLTLVALLGVAALLSTTVLDAEDLQADNGRQWYRGNMHTHSHWSDGDDYLEMIADWYHKQDYDFLVFTDHNVLADTERWVAVEKTKGGREAYDKLKARFPDWVEERTTDGVLEVRLRRYDEVVDKLGVPGEFLLIQGEEISDMVDRHPVHMNASNVAELLPPMGGASVSEAIQNNVNAVLAQRERTGQPMIAHLNHPNFHYAVTAEDLMPIQGEKFFEVYNGHPAVHNHGDHFHASTERLWDVVLAHRLGVLHLPVMFGLATDDGHEYHEFGSRESNPGRGWVQVLADELTPEALIDALESGRFYASSGVALRRVVSSERGLTVEIEPVDGEEYTIEFIGTRADFDRSSEPVHDAEGKDMRATRRYSDDIGQTFQTVTGTSGSYAFEGDELYVRARITSSAEQPNATDAGDLKRAWCQPVVGPAVPPSAD